MVLGCVKRPANPSDILSSQTLQNLIRTLANDVDLVVIDSAPVLPVIDARFLSRLADAVVVAVRWEKTPREAVINTLRSLASVHAPIAGVALTRANTERFRQYSYGQQNYQQYDTYYSS